MVPPAHRIMYIDAVFGVNVPYSAYLSGRAHLAPQSGNVDEVSVLNARHLYSLNAGYKIY